MKCSRATALAASAVAFMTLLAAPAWAHEEINPKTVSTGTPVFLTLTAANETFARNRLTARAWRKVWGPRRPSASIPAFVSSRATI